MNIYGYQKTTLLDYPGLVAATIFTGGCNFGCPFCHNSELITCSSLSSPVTEDEIFSFLQKRKNVLSGVCITGGEPTLQPKLFDFIKKIRSFGYKIKLDTNGYLPEVLSALLKDHLLDYIAMDIKSGISGYPAISGIPHLQIEKIRTSISIIENSGINYEFRTTVVKELHNPQDFYEIRDMLSSKSPYFIQSFQDSGNILVPGLSSCDKKTLSEYLSIVQEKLIYAKLRGID